MTEEETTTTAAETSAAPSETETAGATSTSAAAPPSPGLEALSHGVEQAHSIEPDTPALPLPASPRGNGRRNRPANEEDRERDRLRGHIGTMLAKDNLAPSDVVKLEELMARVDQPVAAQAAEQYRLHGRDEGAELATRALWDGLKGTLGTELGARLDDYLVRNAQATEPGQYFREFARLYMMDKMTQKDQEIERLNGVIGRLKAEGREGKGPSTPQGASGSSNYIGSYEEASRRYNLGPNHPEGIDHAEFKRQRSRFGIK